MSLLVVDCAFLSLLCFPIHACKRSERISRQNQVLLAEFLVSYSPVPPKVVAVQFDRVHLSLGIFIYLLQLCFAGCHLLRSCLLRSLRCHLLRIHLLQRLPFAVAGSLGRRIGSGVYGSTAGTSSQLSSRSLCFFLLAAANYPFPSPSLAIVSSLLAFWLVF